MRDALIRGAFRAASPDEPGGNCRARICGHAVCGAADFLSGKQPDSQRAKAGHC